jgi:flagellar basal-body rod modification protein FlgD
MNTGATANISGAGANIFDTSRSRFGDNPFLQLLIAEMRTQTPLEPIDNASFMNQMSQFSSMEQQKELNDNLLNLLHFQGALARLNGLTQGAGMIGHEVEYVVDEKGTTKTGVVDSVRVDESGEVFVTIGKKDVPLQSIIGVGGSVKSGDDQGSGKKDS